MTLPHTRAWLSFTHWAGWARSTTSSTGSSTSSVPRSSPERSCASMVARLRGAEAGALRSLGRPVVERGRHLELVGHRPRALARQVGDRAGEARLVSGAGVAVSGAVDAGVDDQEC